MKNWLKCKGDEENDNMTKTMTNKNGLDVEESLTQLYSKFQDEFVENPQEGQVAVVSHSHLVCNGSKGKKILTIPDLLLRYDSDKFELRDIIKFSTLLPRGAKFFIIHYPESYDIFTIIWKDSELVIPGKGAMEVIEDYFSGPRSAWSCFSSHSSSS
jgi:hypothetical protein